MRALVCPLAVTLTLASGLAAAPAPAQEAAQTERPAPAAPGLGQWLQPRRPFAAGQAAGPLLFDLGVVGDFIGNVAGRRAERDDAGTFAGRENRLFPREVELLLFGQIDPYARGEVRFEAAEEFEDGERELHVGLAEAHLTLLTLPGGLQLKLGQMRARFGLLNERHREALPQPDQPAVLTRFLGEEGLVERGAELSWVAPLPVYLEAVAGVFNGDNDEAFGRGSLRVPLLTGRLRTFLELGTTGALQLGASGATGETEDSRRQHLLGADARYKLTPEGWRHPLLTLGGEALWSWRSVEDGGDTGTRRRSGGYLYGEVQPWRRWAFGLRHDWTRLLEDPGREWALEPYAVFMPSDFLRFRLAFRHTDRDRDAVTALGGPRRLDEVLLQATFFLGAHTPHPF